MNKIYQVTRHTEDKNLLTGQITTNVSGKETILFADYGEALEYVKSSSNSDLFEAGEHAKNIVLTDTFQAGPYAEIFDSKELQSRNVWNILAINVR